MTAVEYLNSFSWLGSRLGLDRIKELMQHLGNPQNMLKVIHLAGTNGKGSTACFVSSILKAAGLKVGLYTSPYIFSLHEQMQINGRQISDESLEQVVDRVKSAAKNMQDHPTTFELITAAAFCWFFDEGCEIVVIETGMGGELDSTNVVAAPELCIITPIDMDHMEHLGKTIGVIAKAKAGIIKKNCPVITSKQHPDAMDVLEKTAAKQNAELYKIENINYGEFSFKGQWFSFDGLDNLKISMLGEYQIENAALAITAAKKLNISESAIREGLETAMWPGRFQLVSTNPIFIADGGHNAQGADALAFNLKKYFPNKKIIFVMGVLADKDLDAITAPILPIADSFFTITPNSARAMDAADLAEYLKGKGAIVFPGALEAAKDKAGDGGVVCYFGSLYGIGEILEQNLGTPSQTLQTF